MLVGALVPFVWAPFMARLSPRLSPSDNLQWIGVVAACERAAASPACRHLPWLRPVVRRCVGC